MMTNNFAIPFLTLLILAAAVATPLSLADTGSDDATMTGLAALASMLSAETPSSDTQAVQPNPVAQVDVQTAVHAETAAANSKTTDDSVVTLAELAAAPKVTESDDESDDGESDDDDDDIMDGRLPS